MKMTMTYPMSNTQNDKTVERFLLEQGYSQKLIRHLRNTENGLTIDKTLVYTTHKLKEGEILSVFISEEDSSENIVPTKMPLHIVFEDEHLLVVNKDAGVPIHPSQGNFDNTLANGIACYFKEKGENFIYRAKIGRAHV